MRAWEIQSDGGIDALALNERDIPKPGPGEVLVKIHASSVNYRDLSTIEDPVSRNLPYPTVPNSDASGEVLEVGQGHGRALNERTPATGAFEGPPHEHVAFVRVDISGGQPRSGAGCRNRR